MAHIVIAPECGSNRALMYLQNCSSTADTKVPA